VLRKSGLIQLIKQQSEKWSHKYVKLAHSTVDALKSCLLDPECRLTKMVLCNIAADEGNGIVSGGEGDGGIMAGDAELRLEPYGELLPLLHSEAILLF
jgi:hypothetical protein